MGSEYWRICIEEGLSEVGIDATDNQVADLVEWVEGAHSVFGEVTGRDCIPDPSIIEIKALRAELANEKRKIVCPECGGAGRIVSACGTSHYSDTSCWKCNGKGKVMP